MTGQGQLLFAGAMTVDGYGVEHTLEPLDIQGLQRRVRLLEEALAEEEREIMRVMAPFVAGGPWVTVAGGWSFRGRPRRQR